MNESAFPWSVDDGKKIVGNKGMTMRDYFAAKAMQAIITNHKLEDCDDFVIAANAYQLADFMLKARGE